MKKNRGGVGRTALGAVRTLTSPGPKRQLGGLEFIGFGRSGTPPRARGPAWAAGRKGWLAPPCPALPNLRALANSRARSWLPCASLSPFYRVSSLASRAPLPARDPGPRHAQPGGPSGPALTLRQLSRTPVPLAPAPLCPPWHASYSPTPRVLLLHPGHPGEARPPGARRLPAVGLRLCRLGPLDRSLAVSRPGSALGVPRAVAASLPERGALSAVPPAFSAGAAHGSPLQPPGPRRPRYEVPELSGPRKRVGWLKSGGYNSGHRVETCLSSRNTRLKLKPQRKTG